MKLKQNLKYKGSIKVARCPNCDENIFWAGNAHSYVCCYCYTDLPLPTCLAMLPEARVNVYNGEFT